jgi:hypothetical protein
MAYNFSTQPGSPAVDAGIDVGIKKDFMGFQVPFGHKPDIGIFESTEIRTDVDNSILDEQLDLYPNPNSGQFKVNVKEADVERIEILNNIGSVVKEITLLDNGIVNIDLGKIMPGIYYLRTVAKNKQTVKKFIIS